MDGSSSHLLQFSAKGRCGKSRSDCETSPPHTSQNISLTKLNHPQQTTKNSGFSITCDGAAQPLHSKLLLFPDCQKKNNQNPTKPPPKKLLEVVKNGGDAALRDTGWSSQRSFPSFVVLRSLNRRHGEAPYAMLCTGSPSHPSNCNSSSKLCHFCPRCALSPFWKSLRHVPQHLAKCQLLFKAVWCFFFFLAKLVSRCYACALFHFQK